MAIARDVLSAFVGHEREAEGAGDSMKVVVGVAEPGDGVVAIEVATFEHLLEAPREAAIRIGEPRADGRGLIDSMRLAVEATGEVPGDGEGIDAVHVARLV